MDNENKDTTITQGVKKQSKKRLFLLLLLIPVVLLVVWNIYKKAFLRDELDQLLQNKTQGLYVVEYDSLHLDEVSGTLVAKNIHVFHDTIVYRLLEEKPSMLMEINIPSLDIYGVKTPKALLNNRIEGRVVRLHQPEIKMLYTDEGKHKERVTPTKEVYEQILGNLKSIQLDSLYIIGAKFNTAKLKDSTKSNFKVGNVNIDMIDIRIDSTAQGDSTRLLFSKSLQISTGDFQWSMPGEPYRMNVDSMHLNSDESRIYVKGFHYKPEFSEDVFLKKQPFQTDRFDFTFKDIFFTGVNMHALLEEKILVHQIDVQQAEMKIYRDLNIPRDKVNRLGSYPHQQLAKLKIPLDVDLISLKNVFVEYKEKNQRTQMSGKVQFYQTMANIHYLSNIRDSTKINPFMDVDISSQFLNKTNFTAKWRFNLFDNTGKFSVSGKLGPMSAKDVNVLTKPMGPASVDRGDIEELSFDFNGDDHQINGQVKFFYNKLLINVLKKNDESGKLKKRGLATFFANIIVRNKNVADSKNPIVIDLQEERDTNRSIFALIWKAIFKGVKQTAGIE